MEALIYITDKTGRRAWNTSVTYGYHQGELRNQQRRLAMVKGGVIKSVDAESARLVMEVGGKEIETATADDAALLAELGL